MSAPIWLIGAGGHAKVVADACRAAGRLPDAIFDDDLAKAGQRLLGVAIQAPIPDLAAWQVSGAAGFLGIGSNLARVALAERLAGVSWTVVIHPTAIIGDEVEIGEGTFIAPRVVINPGTRIGAHAIINTGAIIEHDCEIGNYAHIAPGSVLTGGVRVGRETLVGAGTVARPGVRIGEGVVCGAGAIVVRDIADRDVVTGVPARPIDQRR